jgi:hypothetical protein
LKKPTLWFNNPVPLRLPMPPEGKSKMCYLGYAILLFVT